MAEQPTLRELFQRLEVLGVPAMLSYVKQEDGKDEWCCEDGSDSLSHEHGDTPEEATQGLLTLIEARQAEAASRGTESERLRELIEELLPAVSWRAVDWLDHNDPQLVIDRLRAEGFTVED